MYYLDETFQFMPGKDGDLEKLDANDEEFFRNFVRLLASFIHYG